MLLWREYEISALTFCEAAFQYHSKF